MARSQLELTEPIVEPRDLLFRQIVASVDARYRGVQQPSRRVGMAGQLAPSRDARGHGELVAVEVERRKVARRRVVVSQLELDLAEQGDVIRIPRLQRIRL